MQEKQALIQQQTQQSLVDQAGQLAGTPLMDPVKNSNLGEQLGQGEALSPDEGGE
jgi:hypothetical protein